MHNHSPRLPAGLSSAHIVDYRPFQDDDLYQGAKEYLAPATMPRTKAPRQRLPVEARREERRLISQAAFVVIEIFDIWVSDRRGAFEAIDMPYHACLIFAL